MLPNFLYIGPPKSGSTWLFETLRQHPEIYIPISKDFYFFDRYYSRGLDWYSRQFESATVEKKCIGEISHDYLYSKDAAARIKADLITVKLLTILRNPFDRAISHYKFSIRNGVNFNSFADGLIQRPTIIDHGLYYKHLMPYFELFEKNKLLICLFDDLKKSENTLRSRVLEFLDVEKDFVFSEKINRNSASTARFNTLAKVVHKGSNIARDVGFGSTIGKIKRSELIKKVLYKEGDFVSLHITKNDFNRLQASFLPDIIELEKLLGLDLTSWKETSFDSLTS